MIKKITVEIDGEDVTMSYEAAQKLFQDLKQVFPESAPFVPYYPNTYPYVEDPNKWSIPCGPTCAYPLDAKATANGDTDLPPLGYEFRQ